MLQANVMCVDHVRRIILIDQGTNIKSISQAMHHIIKDYFLIKVNFNYFLVIGGEVI
jgi:hypothetical protein